MIVFWLWALAASWFIPALVIWPGLLFSPVAPLWLAAILVPFAMRRASK